MIKCPKKDCKDNDDLYVGSCVHGIGDNKPLDCMKNKFKYYQKKEEITNHKRKIK